MDSFYSREKKKVAFYKEDKCQTSRSHGWTVKHRLTEHSSSLTLMGNVCFSSKFLLYYFVQEETCPSSCSHFFFFSSWWVLYISRYGQNTLLLVFSKQNNPTENKALKIHGMATEKEVFSALKMTLLNKSDSTENCTSPLTFQRKKSRE